MTSQRHSASNLFFFEMFILKEAKTLSQVEGKGQKDAWQVWGEPGGKMAEWKSTGFEVRQTISHGPLGIHRTLMSFNFQNHKISVIIQAMHGVVYRWSQFASVYLCWLFNITELRCISTLAQGLAWDLIWFHLIYFISNVIEV